MPDASPILPSLSIGGALTSADDLEELKRQTGITALLSLQTDGDLTARGLSWAQEARWCEAQRIEAHRRPIEDWSPQAVIDHLDDAVGLLRRLLEQGHVVYMHCTAGVNRSPSVVLGYLVLVKGQSIDEAVQRLQRARPHAQPYPEVLQLLRQRAVPR